MSQFQFKGEYKKLITRYDKWQMQHLNRIEKDLRSTIKRRCIALGVDCTNTQHSFYTDLDYSEELKRVRIQQFHEFIMYVADFHRVDFYFTVENGKFRWL